MRQLIVPALLSLSLVASASESYPLVPVTTGYLGNTLLRGGGWDWTDPQQTYLQLYTNDMVVTAEGRALCTTSWEEGHRPAGVYRDGDALEEHPGFGTTSGEAVAVSEAWVVYGLSGTIVSFPRTATGLCDRTARRVYVFDPNKDAPPVRGLAIAGDTVFISAGGRLVAWDLKAGATLNGTGVAIPNLERMRLDKRGLIWGVVSAKKSEFISVPVTVSGEADADHPVTDALQRKGDEVHWKDGTGPAALTVDLGAELKPAILRFSGAGNNVALEGARIEGAASVDGPWTTLTTIGREPGWWPETVVHLDERHWRHLRLVRDKGMGLRGLQVQVRSTPTPGAVVAITTDGRQVATVPGINEPVGLTYDAQADRLLVFNDDADQQIHAFTGLEGTPRRDTTWMKGGTFGAKGGLTGAKGVFGPARFDLVRGLGVDAAGNLSVFSVGHTGMSQSRLESFDPKGKQRWEMKGLAFLDMVDTDPGDTATAFSTTVRYQRNPKGRDGTGWTAVGSTLDHQRYPEDPRLHGLAAQVMGVRRIAGKPFLFLTTQYSDKLAIYRFDADGIAVPCAFFASMPGGTMPPQAPAGGSWQVWNDTNGDGRFQADEWRSGANLGLNPFTVDAVGGVWFNDPRAKALRHIPAEKTLDAHGSPRWPAASERAIPFPAVFDDINLVKGVEVAPDGTAAFVFGYNQAHPMTLQSDHPVGRLVVRYDLTGATPTVTHQAELPYDVEFTPGAAHDQIAATSIAGDYLFVGYGRRMDVLALRCADLKAVGRLEPGPQTCRPIFDGPSELIAAKDGSDYDIFVPQYLGNATTHLRWSPNLTTFVPTPTGLSVTRAATGPALTWAAQDGLTQWRIERRDLLSDGWGTWMQVATVPAGTTAWNDPKAPATCGYRLRAEGPAGALSDWSMTRWLR